MPESSTRLPMLDGASDRAGAALGPHTVYLLAAESAHLSQRENRRFAKAQIYIPADSADRLASIVIVPGFACGENTVAAWAPFFASHGFLAMTIATRRPFHDMPRHRAEAMLDAMCALKEEEVRGDSALFGRLDVTRFAIAGWSMGGGGCQLAALADPSLRCVLAFAPHPGLGLCWSLPAQLTDTVPTLIISGQCDPVSWACLVQRIYSAVRGPAKLHLQVRRGDHAIANGPAGGNCCQIAFGCGVCAACTIGFGVCCGNYSPCGAFDRPTGLARLESRNGAIGAIALRWVRFYLRGGEAAAGAEDLVQLQRRPSIASGWRCENLGMERS